MFVYISKPAGTYLAPTQEVVLDQIECQFQPYVFGVMTHQPVRVRNLDPVLHNITTTGSSHPANRFNIAQPVKGSESVRRFGEPELPVTFRCNLHPWMVAYAGVFDHPFFGVTDADGRFDIPAGLPAGRYALVARHLKAGTLQREIDLTAGAPAPFLPIAFEFEANPTL